MQYIVVAKGSYDIQMPEMWGPYRSEERAEKVKEKIIEAFARDGYVPSQIEVKPVEPWIER